MNMPKYIVIMVVPGIGKISVNHQEIIHDDVIQ